MAAVVGLAALGIWAAPAARGALPDDVIVVDSVGIATPVGIITRVPAISDGGIAYSSTALTLDKAQAKAAGFTLGDLVESFLLQSDRPLDGTPLAPLQPPQIGYSNPVLVRAQYPPSPGAGAPAENSAPGGNIHARATDAPSATADAAGGKLTTAGILEGGQASSSSRSEVLPGGTLVTTAQAALSDVRIGGALTIASLSSRAVASVPPKGKSTNTLKIVASGVSLNGVPAQITPDGLRVADQVPVSTAQLAQFQAGLDQLAAQGISITGFPGIERRSEEGDATAKGAAVGIHYNFTGRGLPNSGLGDAPYDEEFLLGQVQAGARMRLRAPGSLPGLGGEIVVPGTEPSVGGGASASAVPELALSPSAGGGASTPVGVVAPAAAAPDLVLNRAGRTAPAVTKLRTEYRIFITLAFLGLALFVARVRTRLN